MEMLTKHAHSKKIMDFLESLASSINFLAKQEADKYILIMLNYALKQAEPLEKERFEQFLKSSLPPEMEEEAMTLADVYRQEGWEKAVGETKNLADTYRQEGIQAGVQQGVSVGVQQTLAVLDMLRQNKSLAKITQATGLAQEQVLEIQRHLAN